MENINWWKSKQLSIKGKIYTITFCFFTQLKSTILTIKIGVIFLCVRTYFSLSGWTGFFCFVLFCFVFFGGGVFKCLISACRFLYGGFYCILPRCPPLTIRDTLVVTSHCNLPLNAFVRKNRHPYFLSFLHVSPRGPHFCSWLSQYPRGHSA